MSAVKPLWESTRDLHHACEKHIVGESMATGKPPEIWFGAWLIALRQIHSHIDPHSPEILHRVERLNDDIKELKLNIPEFDSAAAYCDTLTDEKSIAGALYVLTGAHLMGGEIMRRRLIGYPTQHLEWTDRKEAIAVLQTYRMRDDITDEARACFSALLSIMDEILYRYNVL